LNTIQRPHSPGTLPIVLKFHLVYQTPFFDDGGDFARQITFADVASGYFDQCLKSLICHMRTMMPKKIASVGMVGDVFSQWGLRILDFLVSTGNRLVSCW